MAWSLLTWNISFDEAHLPARMAAIATTVTTLKPDIVCLQEATAKSLVIIITALVDYHCFEALQPYDYGNCLLYRRDTIAVDGTYVCDYPSSRMGRRLLWAEVRLLSVPIPLSFTVATTHLESMWPLKEVRSQQCDVICNLLETINTGLIVAGDFNISFKEPSDAKLAAAKFTDCWVAAGCPLESRDTYNGATNQHVNRPSYLRRFDRVYYRFVDPFLAKTMSVHSLQLIGQEIISASVPVPPSDHYGLLVNFQLNSLHEVP